MIYAGSSSFLAVGRGISSGDWYTPTFLLVVAGLKNLRRCVSFSSLVP